MQIDTITLTGTAEGIPGTPLADSPVVPFSVAFTVDTTSGLQSFGFCGPDLCGFSATGLTVTNLSGSIGGAAQDMGSGGAAFGSGVDAGLFGGVNAGRLTWDFDEYTGNTSPTLASILAHAPADAQGQSSLNGYSLTVEQISITDPPAFLASIPEPGTLALLAFGLLAVIAWRTK
jgi:hypothetical protein